MVYKIDTSHSEVMFKVKHLMITNVTGQFKDFDGTLEYENEDLSDAKVEFTAKINSIDTKSEDRDVHLKSKDFFDAIKFPEMKFVSTGFTKITKGYLVTGNLTIRNRTKPVKLKATFSGQIIDPWGQTKVGFEAEGKIRRKKWGLKWNATTEAGGVVVSDEVKLQLNAQFIKQ